MRLTERAHTIVAAALARGAVAVDATAGNGHDTQFLAARVGRDGHVYAVDIQARALKATRERLQRAATADHAEVTLIHGCHSRLRDYIPPALHGQIGCVMFNLGYLPGADHAITTTAPTTLAAVDAGVALLRPGGVMTIMGYVGHPHGAREVDLLDAHLRGHSHPNMAWEVLHSTAGASNAPRLYVVRISPPHTAR